MKLVDDWKKAWRWISINCMLLATAIQAAWLSVPENTRLLVPEWLIASVTITLMVLGVIGRLVKQGE